MSSSACGGNVPSGRSDQNSVCSASSIASSTSMPRYRTVCRAWCGRAGVGQRGGSSCACRSRSLSYDGSSVCRSLPRRARSAGSNGEEFVRTASFRGAHGHHTDRETGNRPSASVRVPFTPDWNPSSFRWIWSRTRMAQMSLGRSGDFCPTSFALVPGHMVGRSLFGPGRAR